MERNASGTDLSRRTFLATGSAAIAGAALGGLASRSEAATRDAARSGSLKFATRLDATGLDSHRHNQYHTSMPIAAMYTGLTDIDYEGNIVPGIAKSWESNKALTSWVFKLRKGVLFHNGREVDADAVKQNLMRIKDPQIGSGWHRGTIKSIETVEPIDKYTVRINLSVPDAALPANVMHYPTNLQAPDNFEKSSEHPIGTGPFKFVSWKRFGETRLTRFENYWETDAAGNNLPYLDDIIGRPKREDAVRLTALRAGEVNLIDHMAYASVDSFKGRLWRPIQHLAAASRRRHGHFQLAPRSLSRQRPANGCGPCHQPGGDTPCRVLWSDQHDLSALSQGQPLAHG